jgi:hypothetical protein
MSTPAPANTQVAKFIEAPIAGRPISAPLGTFFYATDTLDLYAFSVNLTTGTHGWVIVGSGGGAAQPATQILEGTGTGVTSSPSLTYSQALGTLTAADQESPPASILDVVGTASPATRAVNVRDQSLRSIFQIIANNAVRTISMIDEASVLLLQVATLAAQRTLTVFDTGGSAAVTIATIVGALAVTFGKPAANRLKVDITNGQLLALNAAGSTMAVLDETTGAMSLGGSTLNGTGSLTVGPSQAAGATNGPGMQMTLGGVSYPAVECVSQGGFSTQPAVYFGGVFYTNAAEAQIVLSWGTTAAQYGGQISGGGVGFSTFIQNYGAVAIIIEVNSVALMTARADATGCDFVGHVALTGKLDLTSATATVSESYHDSSGTPGNATANTIRGRVAMAIGTKTLTLTNSLIAGTTSSCKVWIDQTVADTTATSACARCTGAGSATIATNANATAATTIGFEIAN